MSTEYQFSKKSPEQPRAWQRMLSGRRLDLLNPSPLDIEIDDIAHGLARVARWNGQTKGTFPFSVAQHCILVEEIVREFRPAISRADRLAALLHDAPEYVIGDLISPFKAALGIDYKDFERKLLSAIHIRFGLPPQIADDVAILIKHADQVSAFHEATQLAGFDVAEGRRVFGRPPARLRTPKLVPLSTEDAEQQFLGRFRRLSS